MFDYNNVSALWLCFWSLMIIINNANIWESSAALDTCNPSPQDVEVKGLPWVQNHPRFLVSSSLLSLHGKEKIGKKNKVLDHLKTQFLNKNRRLRMWKKPLISCVFLVRLRNHQLYISVLCYPINCTSPNQSSLLMNCLEIISPGP